MKVGVANKCSKAKSDVSNRNMLSISSDLCIDRVIVDEITDEVRLVTNRTQLIISESFKALLTVVGRKSICSPLQSWLKNDL